MRNVFGDCVTQTRKIANLFNYRFSTHGKFQGSQHPLQISGICNPKQKTINFPYVTEGDCHDAIRALGRKKPIGPSKNPARAIKDSSSVIVPHLNFLVNYCIKLSCFPNELKQAHVVPLYIRDDPEEPNNYRRISITPCLSKIIENLRDEVCQYLHNNKLLIKNQYGFRKNYHLNVQSILSKKEQLRTLVHDLGPNCIFCFTETWLCEFDDKNVFNLDKERYCCFRTDRISPAVTKTKKDGGVMTLAPKVFSQKKS